MNQLNHYLSEIDPDIQKILKHEEKRQTDGLELIASENYCSLAVRQVQASVLTNKYAEGYPGKRYYDGCDFVDQAETLAIERVKKLFKCEYANVQPHSGSNANMAAYMALIQPGDTILGMELSEGGHLTHGSPVNFSGKLYKVESYGIDPDTETINYDLLREKAKSAKPKMIIAGASAYPRVIDFKIFREIADEVGAYLLVDMAHIAGLVAAGIHPSPLPYADVVTSTTHKTLRGPRGGIILSNNLELGKKFNSSIFPGIQGGPLEHVIAAKAVAFQEALSENFKAYQEQTALNAKTLGEALISEGLELVSGGTDNHLVLLKTTNLDISGKEASTRLENVHITCNKNMIPKDTRSPFVTSGVRMGTPAITSRGMGVDQMKTVAKLISRAVRTPEDKTTAVQEIQAEVLALCNEFPLYTREIFNDDTTRTDS